MAVLRARALRAPVFLRSLTHKKGPGAAPPIQLCRSSNLLLKDIERRSAKNPNLGKNPQKLNKAYCSVPQRMTDRQSATSQSTGGCACRPQIRSMKIYSVKWVRVEQILEVFWFYSWKRLNQTINLEKIFFILFLSLCRKAQVIYVLEFKKNQHQQLISFKKWRWGKIPSAMAANIFHNTEPVFVNVYGAQESIPRNRFRQPI
jgi:hypothetical protein